MPEKAFTMRSNQYCGTCGSFDLVKDNPGWISMRMLGRKPAMCCHGCDRKFSEADFVNNSVRTLPLTVDDFFFQTNLRNIQLLKKQIRPVTQALGFSLIAIAVTGLFLIKSPNELRGTDRLEIKWASNASGAKTSHHKNVVKALQREFDKLVAVK